MSKKDLTCRSHSRKSRRSIRVIVMKNSQMSDGNHLCREYDKWNDFERGVYTLAFSHGVKYPDDYPRFKFCPFCGEKITVERDPREIEREVKDESW